MPLTRNEWHTPYGVMLIPDERMEGVRITKDRQPDMRTKAGREFYRYLMGQIEVCRKDYESGFVE